MTELRHDVAGQRRPDRAAFAIGAALGLLGLLVGYDASRLSGGSYAQIGPTAFPYAIAAALIVLSGWTFVEAWRGRFPAREDDKIGPIAWIVGGLAAQALLLHPAGFSIATGLLFAATARAFGKRQLWKTIPIGILMSLAVWGVFFGLLRLRLPAGPLESLFI
ncbi:tripartite tricarboxylate transporter TctB family protein [Aureimonas altamirensis]|uniref:tripartite tricarboxylate transporter TctB family protein n=1 Tax=Aureimonas altamirensis TaxID=370622 RepID=UPI0020372CDD|nr:tripartite tricarboxylate transporter TctB family protein [Aureimonas altamirensis]MCM2503398.1 tripartite tricarboxylate transporter TctB family protein [Aureimonas altamirensis]